MKIINVTLRSSDLMRRNGDDKIFKVLKEETSKTLDARYNIYYDSPDFGRVFLYRHTYSYNLFIRELKRDGFEFYSRTVS